MAKTFVDPEVCKSFYPNAILVAREVAREHGYAIGVHGSQLRDLDLIAVPWTAEASEAEVLVKAISLKLNWWLHPKVELKPHGRKAWLIYTHHHAHIDISVTPKIGV